MKRSGLIGLLALVVGGSGCAATSRRDDGTLMFKPRAWSAAPAPEQVQVTPMSAAKVDTTIAKADPQGLSKYFPGLRKGSPEPTNNLAMTYRPTWFGLRKPKAPAQVYATDSRTGLYHGPAEPSLLPVALRVPTDPAVKATGAETVAILPAATPEAVTAEAKKPYDEDANPLPPAAEAEVATVVDRMPEVPPVDPRQDPQQAPATNGPEGNPPPDRAMPDDPGTKGDEKAVKAVTNPADPAQALGLPEVTLPASYIRHDTMPAPGHVHTTSSKGPVLASPQIAPTSKVVPSPQSTSATSAKKWQRPCLRRFIRKHYKLGEYATPPTAAPH